jgi:hypothetical protein
MNVVSMSKRFAATGAVAALAAAALVGVSTTSANATPVTNSYTCSNASFGLGPWTVGLVSDAPGIEGFPQIPAGFDAPAGLLTLTNHFTIPDDAHTTLTNSGVEDLAFPEFAGSFGSTSIGVSGMTAQVSEMTDNGDGTHSFDSNGLNDAFAVPAAGVYPVLSPESFTMTATVPTLGPVPVACTLAEGTEPGAYTTITAVKNQSTVAGKAAGKLKKGKVAKLVATVGADNQVPTGKVLVKKGSKTLGTATLKAGKATVNLGKLKKGTHKVTVVYKGDGYTTAGSDPVTLKVT